MCSKCLAKVTGSFWIRSDFCCQVILLISSVSSYFLYKDFQKMRPPRFCYRKWAEPCGITFLHFSEYSGDPLKFLNTLNRSSRCINLLTQSSDFRSPAYFFPLDLHFWRDNRKIDALFWICLIRFSTYKRSSVLIVQFSYLDFLISTYTLCWNKLVFFYHCY